MATPVLGGVVLVGGRSRRMGRDKARLSVAGIPLWRRQVRRLETAGAHPVFLALRPRQRSLGEPEREIRDRHIDVGPLGGLHAAFTVLPRAEWIAVLAVDMPRVGPAWFRRLRARCRPGVGAVMVEPEGFQPLAAIYPRAAFDVLTRRLRKKQFALQGLVAELVRRKNLVVVPLPVNQRWRAANWNEPGDIPFKRGND